MGKKSAPAQPVAPDPVATAQAQATINTDAAKTQANLNRINQVTPQGSLTYSTTGTNSDGTPQYTQTQTYSPDQQALYDQQNKVAQALGGLANDNVSRVAEAQSKPFTFDGMTPLQTGVPTSSMGYINPASAGGVQSTYGTGGRVQSSIAPAGSVAGSYASGGDITRGYASGGDVQGRIADAGNVQRDVAGAGTIQSGLDFSKLSALPGGDTFNVAAQKASDTAYAAAASRLDPQYAQAQSDMRARLANSGIAENSEAYTREMDNFSRNRTDAYQQANYGAYSAGLAAQAQGYGQALSTRQQGVNEITTAGNFANNAEAQQYGQNLSSFNAHNSAQGQVFGQNQAQLEANNSAQAQREQENAARASFGNNAQAQAEAQNAARAAFGNSAQGQVFGQNAQQGAFANSAQAQRNSQNQSAAAFGNQAQDQRFTQDSTATTANNATSNTEFNQNLTNANLNNNARTQQIQEASYLRNLPLNDIATLMGTGGGAQTPTFNSFAQVGVAAPDYSGLVQNNYQNAMSSYNQQMQARSQGLGSIFGLAGSLGGAAIMASDSRLKSGLKHVTTLGNGIKAYSFYYAGSGEPQYGFIAQEVAAIMPEAVYVNDNGYMAVDYAKVMNGN